MDEHDEALSVRAQARLGSTLRGKYRLDRVLGIRIRVALVEPYSLERSEGKAKRVIDRRVS